MRAAIVRRRIWAKGEMVRLRLAAKGIEHDARLNTRESSRGIELENLVHVLREIEHNGDVAALSRRGSCRHRGAELAHRVSARRYRSDHILRVSGNDEPDRNLAVIRAVGCIERTAAAIETHFTPDSALEFAFKFSGLRERIDRLCVGTERRAELLLATWR